ncbi:MAG: ABC transporter substrate-binding protein [bacterium]|nr:ABC transporter substrate-binding protein [bacterium]
MTRKLIRIFALMAALALVAAACGDTEEAPPPPPETVVVTSIVTETETITETVTEVVTSVVTETETVTETVEVEVPVEVEMENPLAGTTVTVFGPESSDAEAGSHQAALDIFAAQNGMTIQYTGERSFSDLINAQAAGGNPPDIAVFPQPGKIADFAREGWLLPIPDDVLATMDENIGAAWNSFGNVDGVQYAIPTKADLKSLVWYRPADFAANGYDVPTTWADLRALTQQMINDGNVPWCVGIESGGATGWAFTDWVEDLTLRYQGAEFYDQWVDHSIPFNSPEMNAIWTEILDLWNTPGAVYAEGGTISSTFFGDNGRPLVEGDCMMHRQASFFSAFFPDGTGFGPDGVDVFYFPSVSGDRPVLGAGTLVAAFRDAPEVWAVMEYYATPQYADNRQRFQNLSKGGGAVLSGFLSPNLNANLDLYQPLEQSFLDILFTAEVVRFDGSDLMPAAVGAGTFWTEATSAVNGDKTVEEATQAIENSWP